MLNLIDKSLVKVRQARISSVGVAIEYTTKEYAQYDWFCADRLQDGYCRQPILVVTKKINQPNFGPLVKLISKLIPFSPSRYNNFINNSLNNMCLRNC